MQLQDLKAVLNQNPALEVRFRLPDGNFAPAHAHVTEVARVDKRFIDCGGTRRSESFCRLQVWSAQDFEHRLTAGKLLKILAKAESVLETDALEVDVEYEGGFISQFPLAHVEVIPNAIILHLDVRHTACLAEDKCGIAPEQISPLHPLKFDFRPTPPERGCCA